MTTEQPQSEYEAALDALTDPRAILARAMMRAMQADQLHKNIVRDQQDRLWGVAFSAEVATALQQSGTYLADTYAQIATAVARLTELELAANPARLADLGDADDAIEALMPDGPQGLADDGPHALGMRFTADFTGESVGRTGGRDTVFVPHFGWIDVSYAEHVGPEYAQGAPARIVFRGRAVSRYNDQVLCITDGGTSLVLPAALVDLEADE